VAKGGFTNPKAVVEVSNSKDAEEPAPRRRVRCDVVLIVDAVKQLVDLTAVACLQSPVPESAPAPAPAPATDSKFAEPEPAPIVQQSSSTGGSGGGKEAEDEDVAARLATLSTNKCVGFPPRVAQLCVCVCVCEVCLLRVRSATSLTSGGGSKGGAASLVKAPHHLPPMQALGGRLGKVPLSSSPAPWDASGKPILGRK
jgi:hypothetical protein